MDYYTQLKPESEKVTSAYSKTVSDLKVQIPKIEKRLVDERANRDRLKNQIEKLQELSIESVSGTKSKFEKYKVSQKKKNSDLEVSEQNISNIETNILPNAKGRLQDAERNLRIVLNTFILNSRVIPDMKIQVLLRDMVNERQDFLDGIEKIYSDYGLGFVVSDEAYCPGVFSTDEIRDLEARLGMNKIKEPSQEQVWANYHKTIKDSESSPEQQDAVAEPSGSETSSEGTSIPSEPVSQAVATQSAENDAVGEVPEIPSDNDIDLSS